MKTTSHQKRSLLYFSRKSAYMQGAKCKEASHPGLNGIAAGLKLSAYHNHPGTYRLAGSGVIVCHEARHH